MNGINLNTARRLDDRRKQLGMSRAALAKLAGVSEPTVTRVLTGREPSPGVATLQALALALQIEFRIGQNVEIRDVIPAQKYREQRAREKAKRLVSLVQGTMALEAQAVDESTVREMVKQTVHELMAGPNRKLWC